MKPTQEQVLAWFEKANGWSVEGWDKTIKDLEQFAALVAAAERDACAKVCDDLVLEHPGRADLTAKQCAAAIRARGQG